MSCKKGYGSHDFCVVNTETKKVTCVNCGAPEPSVENEALKLLEEIEGLVLQARGKLYDLYALKKRMVKDYEKRKDSSGTDVKGDIAEVVSK